MTWTIVDRGSADARSLEQRLFADRPPAERYAGGYFDPSRREMPHLYDRSRHDRAVASEWDVYATKYSRLP